MLPLFQRNFTAYFLNPTGYVFICVFVLLCSMAAFLPDDFVNSNLANLAQLNLWFPLIMLLFVPAVTMGIWADERRLGTDELLLTLPISTDSLVLAKFASAVAIYTVSLSFSMVSNWVILSFLGNPDSGLFISTYLGYELVGITMIAIGMFASLFTSQLTVAYILGGLFNLPLIALAWADAAPVSRGTAVFLKGLSIGDEFEPFGRGIVTLSGTLYFLLIPAVMVYLSMVIINRRYWGAKHPWFYGGHYLWRSAMLLIVALATVMFVREHDRRWDLTQERLSTLSPQSRELIAAGHTGYPIVIEAWISPEVPPEYIQTKLDIISVLGEIKNRSKIPVFVDIREIQPNTRAAWRLERLYDIRPRKVLFDIRGRIREESIFLSIIFRCGPRTIVVPFLNRGLSVEYELISCFLNVGERVKKRLGIIRTDAQLLGETDEMGRWRNAPWPIIDELSKQYFIESVDLIEPVEPKRFDLLLAVQPSSLPPVELAHLADAIRKGTPAVILEDPFPLFVAEQVVGTTMQRKGKTAAELLRPKGEFGVVTAMLGIQVAGDLLWKNYNPYPKLAGLSEEFIFVDAKDGVNNMQYEHLLFPFCGSIKADPRSETTFTPLMQTEAGGLSPIKEIAFRGIRSYCKRREEKSGNYIIAAAITGKVPLAFAPSQPGGATPELNVIYIADLDLITPGFFRLREMGTDVRAGVTFDFDNVTFVLNAIDTVAGQEELIPIRSRRSAHRTLTRIEKATQVIKDQAMKEQIAGLKEFEEFCRQEEEKLAVAVQELTNREGGSGSNAESPQLRSALSASGLRLTRTLEEKQQQYQRKAEESQREVDEYVRTIQGKYKMYAVLFPPLFPLAIGLAVYCCRKYRRKENCS